MKTHRAHKIMGSTRSGKPVMVRVIKQMLHQGIAHYPGGEPISMDSAEAERRATRGEVEICVAAVAPTVTAAPVPESAPPAPEAPQEGSKPEAQRDLLEQANVSDAAATAPTEPAPAEPAAPPSGAAQSQGSRKSGKSGK
jgi:hypothetical protein